ncbi:MAG: hydroxymethylbilane synthase [Fuerstiella sp.]
MKIASRASKLALWQAEHVKAGLEAATAEDDIPLTVQIVHVSTTGDQNQTDALRQFGGTGVFTREVQHSVLAGETDVAVHSLKDLQTDPTDGLVLAAVPEREVTDDALLLPNGKQISTLDELPEGSRIGTGSPRRQAQLLHSRPDLQMLEIRGNVGTRIRKLDEGEFDAIVLAVAGLTRLELTERISLHLNPPDVYPAVGQGALGLECRSDDSETQELLQRLTNPNALAQVTAERALLSTLRAGCHAPLGAETKITDGRITLTAVLLSADGSERLQQSAKGSVDDVEQIGRDVATALLEAGGDRLVAAE